jgi:glucose/arabinose dehydrogenase
VTLFAGSLDHPRWIHVLPNGDVLVAESNAPERPQSIPSRKGIRGWFQKRAMKTAGAATPSANRITLLRDADGDGKAEQRSTFLANLNSPFGMALVGTDFYVANTDALLRFTYTEGATSLDSPGTKVTDLPAGPINHHWTKNVIASPDGSRLYVTVGSNSNVAEGGMDNERDRAAILEVDPQGGSYRVYASGLRNPNGLAWETTTSMLWTAVNERDELGHNLVTAGPGRFGCGPRLCAGGAHRQPWPGLVGRQCTARRVLQWHVHRPARLLESQAAQRLQGDLRAIRRRPAVW